MIINNSNYKLSPNFKAKLNLNELNNIYTNPSSKIQKTCIDTMFNENYLVKKLDNYSIFMKNNVLCKYFSKPKTKTDKILALLQYKSILFARELADRIFLLQNFTQINKANKIFKKIENKPNEYIEELAKIGNSINDKYIIINNEDQILERVAKSKNSTIFVLNHPNYHKDKFIYVIINSILNKLYVKENKQAQCPVPKILVSRNMLKIVHNKIGNIYKKMGLTPIDASLQNKDSNFNAISIHSLLKDFVNNKANIFIFPEGNNSSYQDKPLEERLQNGVANFVKKAVNNKRSVRVVPVSIQYTKEKNNLGKIFIGKPLFFRKRKNEIIYTDGQRKQKIKTTEYKNSTPEILNTICQSMKFGLKKVKDLN